MSRVLFPSCFPTLVGTAALAVFCGQAGAQCTPGPNFFCVTQQAKTISNPNPGGFACCAFYIDAQEGAELTLLRGHTYTFKMDNTSSFHPFYLSTSVIGAGAEPWTEGVTPSGGVSGTQAMTFVVPADAPALLYYQCKNHQRMGWKINIIDRCPADFNGDGFVNGVDFDEYVAAFELGTAAADFNADGFVTGDDFDGFATAFVGGC